jgi:hypothetical protein
VHARFTPANERERIRERDSERERGGKEERCLTAIRYQIETCSSFRDRRWIVRFSRLRKGVNVFTTAPVIKEAVLAQTGYSMDTH